jgi:hypothetical protein
MAVSPEESAAVGCGVILSMRALCRRVRHRVHSESSGLADFSPLPLFMGKRIGKKHNKVSRPQDFVSRSQNVHEHQRSAMLYADTLCAPPAGRNTQGADVRAGGGEDGAGTGQAGFFFGANTG